MLLSEGFTKPKTCDALLCSGSTAHVLAGRLT